MANDIFLVSSVVIHDESRNEEMSQLFLIKTEPVASFLYS